MTLSSKQIGEIAYLYESIAASEQEQLNEGGNPGGAYAQQVAAQQAVKQKAQASASNKAQTGTIQTGTGILGMNRNDTFKRTAQGNLQITNQQGTRDTMDKTIRYGGASYNRLTGKNGNVTYVRSGGETPAARQPTQQQPTQQQRQPAARTTPAATPAKTLPSKPAGPAAAPANAKVLPSKPAGSAMDQWAKANPKLAAAKAERDRTRGTSATTNPLMKDMKSSLPAPAPKAAAFKPATTAVASSTTDKGVVPASNAIAAAPKPKPMVPTRMPLAQSFEYDAYDLVLEYLLSQGHAETVAEAQYLMTEMDAEMIGDIIEARMDPRGRPASGPMNVYAKSKGKPDQAHLDAVKAYDEKQKKKTPEQRKAELDAYKERQRNR